RRHPQSDLISQTAATRQRHQIAESPPTPFPLVRPQRCSQKPGAFYLPYCEATLRALVSSFSRTMLLVSSSGKTIGSSFFPGYSTYSGTPGRPNCCNNFVITGSPLVKSAFIFTMPCS